MNTTQEQLPILSNVSFNVYPSAILGATFTNVRVLGILDASIARQLGLDTAAMHANVYPTLPPGTPNDPTGYLYVRIQHQSGEQQILGLPWIKSETIVALNYNTINAKISNVTPEDSERVLAALNANGFNAIEITFGN